jgi:glutaredoxin
MLELDAERFTLATGILLAGATGLLGFGLERLVRGSRPVAVAFIGAGLAATVVAFSLRVEGSDDEGTILLMTRDECPHCDEARAILDSLQTEYGFDLWEVDVATDKRLTQRYGSEVPVVYHRGDEIASLEVRESAIRNRLDGA